MLRSIYLNESHLIKLCNTKQWDKVTERSKHQPEEAKPTCSAYRGVGSTALSIAVRCGAPLETIQAITEANLEQLVRVRHTRRGTVIHDAVKHGASWDVILWLMERVVKWEKERRWISRGELKPLSFEFFGGGKIRHHRQDSSSTTTSISDGNNSSSKATVVPLSPSQEEEREEKNEKEGSWIVSSYQHHPHPYDTQTTLFNTTDDLGHTILHCLINRICHSHNHAHNNHNDNDRNSSVHDEKVMEVIEKTLRIFPPAVGKVDSDGKTPLDLTLMTTTPFQRRQHQQWVGGQLDHHDHQPQQHDEEEKMENVLWESKLLDITRRMLKAYHLVVCASMNYSPRASTTTSTTSAVISSPLRKRRVTHSNYNNYSGRYRNNVNGGGGGASVAAIRTRLSVCTNYGDDRNIHHTPLSYALLYGRQSPVIQLILDTEGKLQSREEASWHTGHILHWRQEEGERGVGGGVGGGGYKNGYFETMSYSGGNAPDSNFSSSSSSLACMTIVTVENEIPLHVAVTTNASAEVLRLLSKANAKSCIVADRYGFTSVCWLWIRFVIDHSYHWVANDDSQNNNRHHHHHHHRRRHRIVRASNRRLWPNDYARLHQVATRTMAEYVGVAKGDGCDGDGGIGSANKRLLLIQSAVEELWHKLQILLPAAADAMMQEERNAKNMSTFPTHPHHPSHQIYVPTSSSSSSSWSALHAAAYIDCPCGVLLTALKFQPNQLKIKDSSKGRLPLHYAVCKGEYVRQIFSVLGGTLSFASSSSQLEIKDCSPPIALDLIRLFPEGARVADKDWRLPLHLAIEERKKSIRNRRRTDSIRSSSIQRMRVRGRSTPPLQMEKEEEKKRKAEDAPVVAKLISVYPEALERRDGVTKLYPFMQAAANSEVDGEEIFGGVGSESDLNLIFILLKANPAIIRNCW